MVITIKLRENSAYFTPTKILYADNENLEITVRDKGRIVNRGFLLFNENLYALTDKGCVIPHNALKTVNVSELQDRIDNKIRAPRQVSRCFPFPSSICGKTRFRRAIFALFYCLFCLAIR